MDFKAKSAWHLVKQVAVACFEDYVPSMGAALAYYTLFSLAPLLLIVVSVAGLVFGEHAARGEIQVQLRQLMGDQVAGQVQALLVSVHRPAHGALATGLGVLLLLVGATTVFSELQTSLDRIWRVPARARVAGWFQLVRARLLSFSVILVIGGLLMVALLISAALATLGSWWSPAWGNWYAAAATGNALGDLLLGALIFAFIYKFMPRAQVQWKDVWIGASFTAVLFGIGKLLIGLYIVRSGVVTVFGAAGSLAVVLLWVYYSAQIFLIGAEFTWVYANNYGSRRGQGGATTELGVK